MEPRYFLPMSTKKFFFFLKMERKLKGKIKHHFWTKMPICSCTWACPHWSSSFFFLFSFLWMLPLFFLLFFSFDLQGRLCKRLVLIYFFFLFLLLSFIFLFLIFWFIYLFRCDFFFQTWFLFFNKFRWLIFFLVVYHFFGFNWASFFNKGICINLYKLTFSSLLLFHS